VAAANTAGRFITGVPAAPKVAAARTGATAKKDTPTGRTTSGVSTGAPAADEVAIASTGSPVASTDDPAPPKVAPAITLAPASTFAAAVNTVVAACNAPSASNTAAPSTVAAAGTVAALGTGAAVSTGASTKTVTTDSTVCVADDTVVAASTVGAVDRPASEATTGSRVAAAASTGAGVSVDAGAAGDAHGAEDAGDAMDVVAPLAADKANPVNPETPSPLSAVTSTRDFTRMGTPSVPSGGRSASEKRAASRNDKANANASNHLYVRASDFTPSVILSVFLCLLRTAATVLDAVVVCTSCASTNWARRGHLCFPLSFCLAIQSGEAGLQLENQQAR